MNFAHILVIFKKEYEPRRRTGKRLVTLEVDFLSSRHLPRYESVYPTISMLSTLIYKHILFGPLQAPCHLLSNYLAIIPRVSLVFTENTNYEGDIRPDAYLSIQKAAHNTFKRFIIYFCLLNHTFRTLIFLESITFNDWTSLGWKICILNLSKTLLM